MCFSNGWLMGLGFESWWFSGSPRLGGRGLGWLAEPRGTGGLGGGPIGGAPIMGGRSTAAQGQEASGVMVRRLGFVAWCGRFKWTDLIELAGPLGLHGLNGAGESVDDYIPTGGEEL
ncbi:hypothetical protein F511_14550 [Dorcoceras hygrometricum]|uniref:Uncharacterized protein n=1 Tax=Dorcoceras hygrometricum TaxID=472368 RepID=A0A2Z7CJ40_9LAMI|nr:hypothetical protein F511_14550 [Dorcoceras hygrometricum]